MRRPKPKEMLERAMAAKNLRAVDLAEALVVGEGTVSRWLAGHRRPGLASAIQIERLLGIPVDTWMRS